MEDASFTHIVVLQNSQEEERKTLRAEGQLDLHQRCRVDKRPSPVPVPVRVLRRQRRQQGVVVERVFPHFWFTLRSQSVTEKTFSRRYERFLRVRAHVSGICARTHLLVYTDQLRICLYEHEQRARAVALALARELEPGLGQQGGMRGLAKKLSAFRQ